MKHTAKDRTPYVYSVIFKPTGQYYYGSRYAKNCHPSEFFNRNAKNPYTTSSKLVNLLLAEYGFNAFEPKIRKIFASKEECIQFERKFLQKVRVEHNPKFLNLDSKQNSSKAIQNNVETKMISLESEKICLRIPMLDPIPPGWVKGNINAKGKNTNKGFRWIFNPETKESAMISKKENLPHLWIEGRGQEFCDSHSKKLKDQSRKYFTNGHDTILCKESEVPEGYYKGRIFTNKPTGKRKHKYIWINDGVTEKQIPDNISIPEGFCRGQIGGHIWITNGIITKRHYSNKNIPEGFYKGSTQRKVLTPSQNKGIRYFHDGSGNFVRIKIDENPPESFNFKGRGRKLN